MPWYGNTARLLHDTEPDGVRAAARVDHRVAQQRRARARRRQHAAAVVRREQRLEQRRVLEHRAQVQRRAVGQVDELRRRARLSAIVGVLGLGAVQHRQRADLRARAPRSSAAARSPTRSGCSNAAAVGSTTTSSAPLRARSSASNSRHAGAATRPPPDQRERTGGDGRGPIGGGA